MLRQAVALLRGEGLEPEEADDQRERLLAGFRWILVDEYQDIQLKTRIAKTGSWELLDRSGMVVGRLARAFEPPPGTRCRSATVFAVVAWSREASEPQYRDSTKCDAWEVVVPELVFEPESE